ncbi:MAG: DUF2164 domain-containing protein [Gemmatimonadota bacterium]|nr:DUF2164 domain-containing protein [Gemmatimonadota bacterium]
MPLRIDDDRRRHLVQRLQGFFLEEFEMELSAFRADSLLDFLTAALGPQIYNQGVQDARRYLQQRLDDLDGEVHEPDGL